jgi:hypothetical protein
MDSAPFHRKKKLRKLARGKVRLLFLPPFCRFLAYFVQYVLVFHGHAVPAYPY